MNSRARDLLLLAFLGLALGPAAAAQEPEKKNPWVEKYIKSEHRITMRDGVELFTAVYRPRLGEMEVRWPGTVWSLGLDAFQEGGRRVQIPGAA